MDNMPRPRLPNLRREPDSNGNVRWYYQEGHGARTRIRAEYGSPEFRRQYDAAAKGEPLVVPKVSSKSLEWAAERYMESGAWAELAIGTRKQRGNVIKRVIKASGGVPYSVALTKKNIQAGMDRRKDTPDAARHFLLTMRHWARWLMKVEFIMSDPTEGVKVPRNKGTGFRPWDDEDCAKYEARWPLGTHERVWYEVIHCTGLRRGDAVMVGRQHVKNGRGMIRAEKNGETAYFLVSDRLQAALDAGPIGDLTWIIGKGGMPFKKESFGNSFRDAANAAGVKGSAHGIRKTRATIEAEKGASGAKLDAMFGWKTGSNTSAIYIRSANRAKLAFGS